MIDTVILHYTEMVSAEAALQRLCDPLSQVSAHYLIGQRGQIYQLVPPEKRAWHAGISSWGSQTNLNHTSIGIELDNAGHRGGLPAYPASQMEALVSLLEDLVCTYSLDPHRILGHSDIAPHRKQDPGEHFPWDFLAEKGLGRWPTIIEDESPLQEFSHEDYENALCLLGYGAFPTPLYKQQVFEAFQRHFTPHEITGTLTLSIKRALYGMNLLC